MLEKGRGQITPTELQITTKCSCFICSSTCQLAITLHRHPLTSRLSVHGRGLKQLKGPRILLDLEQDGGYGHQVLVQSRASIDPLDTLGKPGVVQQELGERRPQDLHPAQEVAERRDHIFVHQLNRSLIPASEILYQRFNFRNADFL